MIQPILFFVLGALSLFLLVLLAVPGFRRSAERAARRKLEARLPLSLDEIEAGKDALRAEFATATRRFEHEAKALRSERNEQAIATGRAQEEVRVAQGQGDALRETIAALECERADLRASLAAAEESMRDLRTQIAAQEKLMDEARSEANRLEKRFEEASFLASSRQIELVGRESEIERLSEELLAAGNKASALVRELEAARGATDAASSRESEAAARTQSLRNDLAAAQERDTRSRSEAERFRREWETVQADRQKLEAELVEARKERMEVEVEFAALNRLLVSLFPSAAAGGDPAKALQSAAAERDRLEARVAALLREQRGGPPPADAPAGGSPEAVLREGMLRLAAQVTALAARVEGGGGPVGKALESGRTDANAPHPSLAERIRALQNQPQESVSPSAR